jgi:hypothetical protein
MTADNASRCYETHRFFERVQLGRVKLLLDLSAPLAAIYIDTFFWLGSLRNAKD